jgi:SAM-dependent methyltransferase
MQEDLLQALRARYGEQPTPILQQHMNFALLSREKGLKKVTEIREKVKFDFQGKKVLDVGCAYGGFLIHAASAGASAWGVEVSPTIWSEGIQNVKGEAGDINLVRGNILSPSTVQQLATDFDLVLVNDVFEHVYDTARLLHGIHAVTAPGAVLVFAIPNGESIQHVGREAHYGYPGLTLIPPNCWHWVWEAYTAYYRPWSYYRALFHAFGFDRLRLWNEKPILPLEEMSNKVRHAFREAETRIRKAKFKVRRPIRVMLTALSDLRARVEADIEQGDATLLHWKYIVNFWRGHAIKTGPMLDRMEHPSASKAVLGS